MMYMLIRYEFVNMLRMLKMLNKMMIKAAEDSTDDMNEDVLGRL